MSPLGSGLVVELDGGTVPAFGGTVLDDGLALRVNAAGNIEYSVDGSPIYSEDLDSDPGVQNLSVAAATGIRVALGDGNDTLAIVNDGPGGFLANAAGLAITYDGGGQPGDSLELPDAPIAGVQETYSVGPSSGEATLLVTNGAPSQTIRVAGVASIVDRLAADRLTIQADSNPNVIQVIDGPPDVFDPRRDCMQDTCSAAPVMVFPKMTVAIDEFMPYTFRGKSALIVKGLEGDDTVTFNNTVIASSLQELEVDSGAGNDTLVVSGVIPEAVLYGGEGDDTFVVNRKGTKHLVLDGQEGSDSYTLHFGTLLEIGTWSNPPDRAGLMFGPAVTVSDSGAVGMDRLLMVGTAGDDQIWLSDHDITRDPHPGFVLNCYGCPTMERARFTAVEDLTVDLGDGDDQVSGFGRTADLPALTLIGGRGDDRLSVSGVGSTVLGGLGDDTIDVSGFASGDTLLAGQQGSDTYKFQGRYVRLADESLDCVFPVHVRLEEARGFAGNDTVDFSYMCVGVTFDLSSTLPQAIIGGSITLTDGAAVDNVIGTFLADVLLGNERANRLEGGWGDDRLEGRGGHDELFGGDGDDSVVGDAGNDSLFGGAGNDLVLGGQDDDQLNGGEGHDSLYGGAGAALLLGKNGNDSILGNLGDDSLYGGGGDDWLHGGNGESPRSIPRGSPSDGDDWISGANGFDHVDGGNGNNVMDAGADGWRETLYGADGDDMGYSHARDRAVRDVLLLDAGENVNVRSRDLLPATSIAVFRDGLWYIDLDGRGGNGEEVISFGYGHFQPVIGDWDGDGFPDLAQSGSGGWAFDVDGAGGPAESFFEFGRRGDLPLAGDWDGDVADEGTVFRNGVWLVDLDHAGGAAEKSF
ncbi:MAG: hypothetical protein HY000_03295, partial [Planctomycetes bacterium]|nr:hypothetical protein [Planctomycetota bacterium]